jgi:hypothetical protein
MHTIAMAADLGVIEKLRQEELEEARSIQSGMLPVEPLRAGGVRISHEFQPIAEVGGDFLDYFEMTDGCIGLYLGDVSGKGCLRRCTRRWRSARCAAFTKPGSRLRTCCLH